MSQGRNHPWSVEIAIINPVPLAALVRKKALGSMGRFHHRSKPPVLVINVSSFFQGITIAGFGGDRRTIAVVVVLILDGRSGPGGRHAETEEEQKRERGVGEDVHLQFTRPSVAVDRRLVSVRS